MIMKIDAIVREEKMEDVKAALNEIQRLNLRLLFLQKSGRKKQ